ncbi:MAG TPA: DoxX-like family protein [Planctomycetota bacterium]
MRDIRAIARTTLAFVWIYQGLVPKILFPDTGELEIFRSTGVYPGEALTGVVLLGAAQALLGVFHLIAWRSRAPLWLGLIALALLGGGGLITRPDLFILPFNPASLIAMMLSLTAIDMLGGSHRCQNENT